MSVEVLKATPPPRAYRFELLPEEATESALRLLEQPVAEDASSAELDQAVERGLKNALAYLHSEAEERRASLVLLSDLGGLPPTAPDFEIMARQIADHRPRFCSTEFLVLLADRASEEIYHAPERGLQYGELVLVSAANLDRQILPKPIWHDAQVEAWSIVASIRRQAVALPPSADLVRAALAEAEAAIQEAEEHLAQGSGTLVVRAALLSAKASLACDLGELDEGLRAVDQALSILRAAAAGPQLSRALLTKGRLLLANGDTVASLPLFTEALVHVDPNNDRPIALAAQHNLAVALAVLERFPEARLHLQEAFAMVKLLARPLGKARLRWLAGRIAALEGSPELAAECLDNAWELLQNQPAAEALQLDRRHVRQMGRSFWTSIANGWRRSPDPIPLKELVDRSW